MRRRTAAAGSALFFAVAPLLVAGVIPAVLTGWHTPQPITRLPAVRLSGLVLIGSGAVVLLHAFWQFVSDGRGTPAPVAPTEQLVIGGLYRYVRNPMYLAVTTTIVGQALALLRPVLLTYAFFAWLLMSLFTRLYEERALKHQFGAAYDTYREQVPAWLPRRPRHHG